MEKKTTYIEISKDYLKEIPPLKIKKEISTWNMYELVFQDMVKCYLEEMNYTEEKLTLSASEIKEIANKLLFKSEYMWETINETIDTHIGNLLNKRSDK